MDEKPPQNKHQAIRNMAAAVSAYYQELIRQNVPEPYAAALTQAWQALYFAEYPVSSYTWLADVEDISEP